MSNSRGFTITEAVVALLVAAMTVIAIGGLGERLNHHRTTTDSNSAAMSLAERQMESLLAETVQNPTTAQCPTANLCGGSPPTGLTKTLTSRNVDLTSCGPYTVQWAVVDDDNSSATSPLKLSAGTTATAMKTITVTVTLPANPLVRASITRHLHVY